MIFDLFSYFVYFYVLRKNNDRCSVEGNYKCTKYTKGLTSHIIKNLVHVYTINFPFDIIFSLIFFITTMVICIY